MEAARQQPCQSLHKGLSDRSFYFLLMTCISGCGSSPPGENNGGFSYGYGFHAAWIIQVGVWLRFSVPVGHAVKRRYGVMRVIPAFF